MTEHTPGPWKHGESHPGTGMVEIYQHTGDPVAYTTCERAAPDLLAALRRAEPWLGKLIADEGHLNSVAPTDALNTLKMVSDAIAKATPLK